MRAISVSLGTISSDSHDPEILHADLLLDGEKIGTVHQNGYHPRWAFQINKFRWKYVDHPLVQASNPFQMGGLQSLLFDGAAYDSAELAREAVQQQLTEFFRCLEAGGKPAKVPVSAGSTLLQRFTWGEKRGLSILEKMGGTAFLPAEVAEKLSRRGLVEIVENPASSMGLERVARLTQAGREIVARKLTEWRRKEREL